MTVIVRDFRPADAEDWVRVRRAALPYMVITPEQAVFELTGAPAGRRYRMLVAEEDGETTADEPSDTPARLDDYEEWLTETWGDPGLDHRLTSVVVAGGEVAAFSAARTDGVDRYWSGMTGTRRAHRGRGLAKLAKNDSLHRARAAGYTDAYTGNDAGNGPMLAINRWFGYEICATEVRHVRRLG